MKKILGCILLGLFVSSPALAWREAGHFVVCQIAWNNMSNAAQKQVEQILNNKPFAEQCTWPDMVRKSDAWKKTYDWHFINLEDGDSYFDKTTIAKEGDILQALLKASEALKNPATPTNEKRQWLRFIGHFTGDVHQPLHVGRKSDLGGNTIKVTWFGKTTFKSAEILQAVPTGQPCTGIANAYVDTATGECVVKQEKDDDFRLHKIWDLQLIEHFQKVENIQPLANDSIYGHLALAKHLDQGYDESTKKKWQQSFFHQWAMESLDNRGQAYDTGGSDLGADYYDKQIDFVRLRLMQAGYRLAAFMNRTFDPQNYGMIKVRYFDLAFLELKERIAMLLKP
jgi:hypothetical protein